MASSRSGRARGEIGSWLCSLARAGIQGTGTAVAGYIAAVNRRILNYPTWRVGEV